jgi:hypothetical protein
MQRMRTCTPGHIPLIPITVMGDESSHRSRTVSNDKGLKLVSF